MYGQLEIGKSKPRRRDPLPRRICSPRVNRTEDELFGWPDAWMAPGDRFMPEDRGRDL